MALKFHFLMKVPDNYFYQSELRNKELPQS